MAASVASDLEYKDKYRNLKRKLKFLIYVMQYFYRICLLQI